MATPKREAAPIEVDRIFLYEENPRHEPIETEPEIIDYLCKDEAVYNLARSISEKGMNPLDFIGLVEASSVGTKKTYQVWEGNRRLCAIKLLNDPDRAPAHLRKDFNRLSAESEHVPIKKVNAVVFSDHDDLKFWMGVIHDSARGGVGRKAWDADQKARHFGTSNRNRVALEILDAAQELGLITKEEREGKLTTAQRYLNSDIVREAIGIDSIAPEGITYNRPAEDVQKQLARFIADLKNGSIHSRSNRADADTYGRRLARNKEISGHRIEAKNLKSLGASKRAGKKKTRPKQPAKSTHLDHDQTLASAVEARSKKLASLYYSICSVSLDPHTPLLTIGTWAFIESLTALAGKRPEVDFVAFFSNQRLTELGFPDRGAIKDALGRISRNGNSTKHHEISASFDGEQLANDLATVTPVLIKTVEGIAPKK